MGVDATMKAAPRPCTSLKNISDSWSGDSAQPIEAAMKMVVPTANILRMSPRSATLLRARQSALDDTVMPSSAAMSGRTTFTTEASIPSMTVASTISAIIAFAEPYPPQSNLPTTALILLIPAAELSSFLILNPWSSEVLDTWGPPQISQETSPIV